VAPVVHLPLVVLRRMVLQVLQALLVVELLTSEL
jgi:hypothetical protein